MIIAAVLVPAVPAQADDGIPLVGELPVKATTACTDRAPGPYEDLDVWRFSIKGQGQFRSLTLEFQKANGQPDTRTIEQTGTEAWIAVDPGETLVSGRAQANGTAPAFEVKTACTAEGLVPRAPIVNLAAVPVKPKEGPRALAAGPDIGPNLILGSTLVLAGMLLLIVRRRPRGRHRA
jgi:hypothetical protein